MLQRLIHSSPIDIYFHGLQKKNVGDYRDILDSSTTDSKVILYYLICFLILRVFTSYFYSILFYVHT
jgi:hypothetical protein